MNEVQHVPHAWVSRLVFASMLLVFMTGVLLVSVGAGSLILRLFAWAILKC
ncbi:hypothetical protein AB3X91_16010 [Paraburkholderia sp. BR14263]|uniref:hypothetical protein n=1 Tax=unclassified Paraburkholderia TaxID=2615204 RepID=UPI0034CEA7B0